MSRQNSLCRTSASIARAPMSVAGDTIMGVPDVLDRFSPATREWFRGAFAEPTTAQAGAWDAISTGQHALVVAPTGSGKTLSAFLWALDRLASEPAPEQRL